MRVISSFTFGFIQTPVLYNGCRSGEIFSIDVRQRSQKGQSWKAVRLFHDSAVTSVRLLQAEYYLMVADMAGKVELHLFYGQLDLVLFGLLAIVKFISES